MAEVRRYTRTKTAWVPVSYTANETTAIINVNPFEVIHDVFVRTRVAFNGGGTDAIIELGDGADDDRFVAAGNVDETTAGWYMALGGAASNYTAIGRHLYTVADTIDLKFTCNTSGTRNAGSFDIVVVYSKLPAFA